MSQAGIKSYAWQKLSRTLIAQAHARGDVCALCGHPLQPHAPPRSRWSSVTDHGHKREWGGALMDRANLQVVHLLCNTRKENAQRKVTPKRTHSRAW